MLTECAKRVFGIGVTAWALSACVPIPNYYYYAPAISGVVTADGQPVQNVEVKVSARFSEEIQTATTDQAGRFETKPIKQLLLTMTLIGDPLYGYGLDVMTAGQKYEGYVESYVGYAPKQLQVVCELSKPIQTRNRQSYCAVVSKEQGSSGRSSQ